MRSAPAAAVRALQARLDGFFLYKNAIADMGPCFKGWDAYYETTASCCRVASSSSSLLSLAARLAIEEAKRADKQEAARVGMKGEAVETKVEEMGGHWADKPRVDDEQRVVVDWRDASTAAKRRYTFVSSAVYSSVFETRIGTFLLTSFFFSQAGEAELKERIRQQLSAHIHGKSKPVL